jgi:hypothetical protein
VMLITDAAHVSMLQCSSFILYLHMSVTVTAAVQVVQGVYDEHSVVASDVSVIACSTRSCFCLKRALCSNVQRRSQSHTLLDICANCSSNKGSRRFRTVCNTDISKLSVLAVSVRVDYSCCVN